MSTHSSPNQTPVPRSEGSVPIRLYQRILLWVIFGCVMYMLVDGIVMLWPWLVAEEARLTPIHRILLWTGDAVALGWFIHYFVQHAILGRAVRSRLDSTDGKVRFWSVAFVSIVAALLCDLAVSSLAYYDEWRGYQRAITTTALVTEVRSRKLPAPNEGRSTYEARYEFTTANGARHQGVLRFGRMPVEPSLSPATVRELMSGTTPVEVPIRYDPSWPNRSWPMGIDWRGYGRSLCEFSFSLPLGQLPFLLIFLFASWADRRNPEGRWWHSLYVAAPIMAESFWVWFFGNAYALW